MVNQNPYKHVEEGSAKIGGNGGRIEKASGKR